MQNDIKINAFITIAYFISYNYLDARRVKML